MARQWVGGRDAATVKDLIVGSGTHNPTDDGKQVIRDLFESAFRSF